MRRLCGNRTGARRGGDPSRSLRRPPSPKGGGIEVPTQDRGERATLRLPCVHAIPSIPSPFRGGSPPAGGGEGSLPMPPKLPLQIPQLHLEHRRPTVGAGARQRRPLQLADQRPHLLQCQHLIGPDGAVASRDTRQPFDPARALAALRRLFEDGDDRLGQVAPTRRAGQRGGQRAHRPGPRPERLEREAERGQIARPAVHRRRLRRRQVEDQRLQQELAIGRGASDPRQQLVEQDTLVRRVLVDHEDPRAPRR